MRSRGSHTSCSEATDRGTGEGEGEWCVDVAPLAISYDGPHSAAEMELLCKNTGVMGGEPGRVLQSPPASTSEKTSSSQPCLTAGNATICGFAKKTPWPSTGVGWMPHVVGGVDAELKDPEDADSVGVAGK